jgi:uncharacterized protein
MSPTESVLDVATLQRPDPKLFQYYLLVALLTGPASPFVLLPLWFRYMTLRYKFDEEGISMSWGILFKQEVNLTYRRIQDIHLTTNLLQRWMGLAKISLQTAAGSSRAEMCIEGILQAEQLRDYLYSRMRGARSEALQAPPTGSALTSIGNAHPHPHRSPTSTGRGTIEADEVAKTLAEIRDALQRLVNKRGAL